MELQIANKLAHWESLNFYLSFPAYCSTFCWILSLCLIIMLLTLDSAVQLTVLWIFLFSQLRSYIDRPIICTSLTWSFASCSWRCINLCWQHDLWHYLPRGATLLAGLPLYQINFWDASIIPPFLPNFDTSPSKYFSNVSHCVHTENIFL